MGTQAKYFERKICKSVREIYAILLKFSYDSLLQSQLLLHAWFKTFQYQNSLDLECE